MILEKITNEMYWFVIAVLALNLFQRKHQKRSQKKRTATLIAASLVLLLNVLFVLILTFGLPQWLGIPALIVPLAIGYRFRSKIAIFKRICPECGEKLPLKVTLYFDDNLCADCRLGKHPEMYRPPEKVEEPEIEIEPSEARKVEDIDWDEWEPQETAVVCYMFRGDGGEVMLIHKKRGLGNGLINAPGGRIEDFETAAEAAVRETEEETGITPINPVQVGVLNFQFVDGYSLKGYVFFAYDHTGEEKETVEADPFWADINRIPYDKMWEDDQYWLPEALQGKNITGNFIFDDRTMLSKDIQTFKRPK
ncbi:MAG: 8-oxo-dGTP diphosphatase [Spirochaetales bacterium]|nr:8-oxo-dGTP diphosphatase [Spirochaetales bacterium]